MEDFILDGIGFIGNVDFSFVIRLFFYVYIFFWIMVVIWVWFDASERSSSLVFKIFSVVITLIFNVFGLLIYLLVRPADSYEERYLSELEKKYLQLETSGIIKCPSCTFDLEPGFVVCPRCGESVKVRCERCNEYIESHWEYCAYCGVQREVPESLKEKFLSVENVGENEGKTYHATIKQCAFKVGEKRKECIEKVKNIFSSEKKEVGSVKDAKVGKKKKTTKKKVGRKKTRGRKKKK